MAKYTLTRGKNFMWYCTDNESGLVITWQEGQYNETQQINIDNLTKTVTDDLVSALPRALREMGDWLVANHSDIVFPQEQREPQDAEAFGRELKETRQALDITLQELARRSGVDTGLISKIENGKVNPTLQNLLKIANAMGVDLVFEA